MIVYPWETPANMMVYTNTPSIHKIPEANNQQSLRLYWSQNHGRLWRNNVGAEGRLRYGLANDSKQLNQKLKSSDLIGITPIRITPNLVGHTVGVFTSIEVKAYGWRYSYTDKRAEAQLRWLQLIYGLGGIAGFYAGEPLL